MFCVRLELLVVVEDEQMSMTQILAQFVPLLTGQQAPPADQMYNFELQVWSNPINCLHRNVLGTVQLLREDGGMHIVLDSGCHTNTVAPGIYISRFIQGVRKCVEERDGPSTSMPVTYIVR